MIDQQMQEDAARRRHPRQDFGKRKPVESLFDDRAGGNPPDAWRVSADPDKTLRS